MRRNMRACDCCRWDGIENPGMVLLRVVRVVVVGNFDVVVVVALLLIDCFFSRVLVDVAVAVVTLFVVSLVVVAAVAGVFVESVGMDGIGAIEANPKKRSLA